MYFMEAEILGMSYLVTPSQSPGGGDERQRFVFLI